MVIDSDAGLVMVNSSSVTEELHIALKLQEDQHATDQQRQLILAFLETHPRAESVANDTLHITHFYKLWAFWN